MLLAAGVDLPGQANQQDAAKSAAFVCTINVHTPCKKARATVTNCPLSETTGWRSDPPHLLCLSPSNKQARRPENGRQYYDYRAGIVPKVAEMSSAVTGKLLVRSLLPILGGAPD